VGGETGGEGEVVVEGGKGVAREGGGEEGEEWEGEGECMGVEGVGRGVRVRGGRVVEVGGGRGGLEGSGSRGGDLGGGESAGWGMPGGLTEVGMAGFTAGGIRASCGYWGCSCTRVSARQDLGGIEPVGGKISDSGDHGRGSGLHE